VCEVRSLLLLETFNKEKETKTSDCGITIHVFDAMLPVFAGRVKSA